MYERDKNIFDCHNEYYLSSGIYNGIYKTHTLKYISYLVNLNDYIGL